MSEDKITKDGKKWRIQDVVSIEVTFTINEINYIRRKCNEIMPPDEYIKQKALEGYNDK